jgi:hypothetical protein
MQPNTQPEPKQDNLKALYSSLTQKGYRLPASYDQFNTDMQDSEKLNKLYSSLIQKGFKLPSSFEKFQTDMLGAEVKKKDIPYPAMVPEEQHPAFQSGIPSFAEALSQPVQGSADGLSSQSNNNGIQNAGEPGVAEIANSTFGELNRKFYGLIPDLLNTYGVAEKAVNNYITAPLGLEDKVERLEDTYGGKASKAIRDEINNIAYVSDRAKDNIAVQLGGGIGQVLSLALTAGSGSMTNLPALTTSTATKEVAKELSKALTSRTSQIASAQMVGHGFKQAKAEGATDGEAFAQAFAEGMVAKTEAIPIGRALERVDNLTGNRLTNILVNGATGGAEELAQEAFQGYLSNVAAESIYDEGRDLLAGVKDQAVVGGGTGFIFNALLSAIGGRKRVARNPQEVEQLEQLEQEVVKAQESQNKASEQVIEKVGKDLATSNFIEQETKRISESAKIDGVDPNQVKQEIETVQKDPKSYAQQQLEIAESLQEELSGKESEENQKRIEVLKEISESLIPAQTQKAFSDVAATGKHKPGTRIQPSPIKGIKPKKLRDITLDLSKGISSKIYFTKKPASRRALGSYNPGNAAIAIKYNNDLDTTAHELGHALDDKFGILSDIPTNQKPAISKELKKFSGYGSKPPKGHPNPQQYREGEGVAEFFRAYIVNPDVAKKEAPEFYKWVEQTVPKDTWGKVETFSNDVRAFVGASAHDMIAANIDFGHEKAKGSILSRLRPDLNNGEGFHLGFADKVSQKFLNPFRAYEKAFQYAADVKGEKIIKPEKDPRIMARLFLGVNEKLDNVLENGLVNSRNERLVDDVSGESMSLKWLVQPFDNSSEKTINQEMTEAVTYMVAERTVELKGRFGKDTVTGIGAGIFKDIKVAQKRLDEVNKLKETDPAKYERLVEGARRYRQFADGVLQYMVEKGRLSKGAYQEIKKNNIQYVALKRINEASPDEPIQVFSRNSKAIGASKNIINKIKGSSKSIKDPYSSLLDFTHKAIKEADRNEVMLAFRDVFVVNRPMGDKSSAALNLSEIARPAAAGDPNTVKIFNNGELEHWQLQDDVFKAVNNITDASYNLPPLLTFLPRALRWTVTNFPVFALRNAIRDFQHRLVISANNPESGYDVYANKGKRKEVKDLFQLFGGGQAGYYMLNDSFYNKQMEFAVDELSKDKRTIIGNPKKLAESYQKWISSSELLSRLPEFSSAFKKAKKEGLDDYNASLYAAFQSRDLMDFAVAGEYMRIVNQLIPFSNAAIQGLRKTVRSAQSNPKEFAFRMFLYSIVPAVANRILIGMSGRDEEYQELPGWRRDLFFNIPLGTNLWLTIPKPFEIGVLGSGSERLADKMFYGNDKGFEGYMGSVARATLPVDEAALAGPLRSFVEVMTNHDFFRDKHIISPHEEGKDVSLRNTERASRLSKALQSVVGADARYLDHVISSQFSYFGGMALKLSDIGREDRRNQFDLGDLGIFKSSPAYESNSVQWVLGTARSMDLHRDPLYKELNILISDYFNAETDKDREKRAATIREFASKIWEVWEEYGLDTPEGAKNQINVLKAENKLFRSTNRKAVMEAEIRKNQ